MKKKSLNLNVVLVEPNGPINVGSIARLCSNFDVNELRIVSPNCDIFSLEAKKMALKGKRYIDNCKIFNSIEHAIFDCDLVLATCGRIDLVMILNVNLLRTYLNGFHLLLRLII